jgi:hypothetical protein
MSSELMNEISSLIFSEDAKKAVSSAKSMARRVVHRGGSLM